MTQPVFTTDRQTDVLAAIDSLSMACGYPPSIRELCTELGVSSNNAIFEQLAALEGLGLIARKPKLARSVLLTELGRKLLKTRRGSGQGFARTSRTG